MATAGSRSGSARVTKNKCSSARPWMPSKTPRASGRWAGSPAPAANLLEQDLKTKVIFALAAEMWHAYATLSIHLEVDDCGELLRGDYRPSN